MRINNLREPDMTPIFNLAEEMFGEIEEEKIFDFVWESKDFHLLICQEVSDRITGARTRRLVKGIKSYIPHGISFKQCLALFNTYNTVIGREKKPFQEDKK